ncbi:MAG: hypothetical protein FD180_1150 [Planctomycetota bacterium]|nr:MAG: hypothetical protein FD180_1150 [Planctomycetota bacterium]
MSAQDNFDSFPAEVRPMGVPASLAVRARPAAQAAISDQLNSMIPRIADQVFAQPGFSTPRSFGFQPSHPQHFPLVILGENTTVLPGVIPPIGMHAVVSGPTHRHSFPLVVLGETIEALPGINPSTGMPEIGPGLVFFQPKHSVDCNTVKDAIIELMGQGKETEARELFEKFVKRCPRKLISLTEGTADMGAGRSEVMSDWDCKARLAFAAEVLRSLQISGVIDHPRAVVNWQRVSEAMDLLDLARCVSSDLAGALADLKPGPDPTMNDGDDRKKDTVKKLKTLLDEIEKDQQKGRDR